MNQSKFKNELINTNIKLKLVIMVKTQSHANNLSKKDISFYNLEIVSKIIAYCPFRIFRKEDFN